MSKFGKKDKGKEKVPEELEELEEASQDKAAFADYLEESDSKLEQIDSLKEFEADLQADLDVKLVRHGFGVKNADVDEKIQEYLDARKAKDQNAQGSFADYIKEKYYKDQNVIVVPDLSNAHIEIADLRGADFSGCNMAGARFQFCDLEGAIFCDADLSSVEFFDANLKGADMRGADLSGTRFMAYDEGDNLGQGVKRSAKLEEIKFSTTKAMVVDYMVENIKIRRKVHVKAREKLNQILKKVDTQISKKFSKLSFLQANYYRWGAQTGDQEFDANVKKKKDLLNKIKNHEEVEKDPTKNLTGEHLKIPYLITPSMVQVMQGEVEFDPAYKRGSSIQERARPNHYVRMKRDDVKRYLAELKKKPELRINDFAKQLASERNIPVPQGARVIADASTRKIGGGLEVIDLSGLSFVGAHLEEACFVGANCKGANFADANLERANFESANLEDAKLLMATGRDANFFHANMKGAKIQGSDMKRAFMSHSNGKEADIVGSNFDFAVMRHGNWKRSKIKDSNFRYADMEGISLANADIQKSDMQHAVLNDAVLKGAKLVFNNMSYTYLQDADSRQVSIEKTILKNVQAQRIDLTEAKLDEQVDLEEADLKQAVMDRIKAKQVNFKKANMDLVKAELADLEGAILKKASVKFAKMEGVILDKAQANGADFTGANLDELKAREAQFKAAVMRDIKARRAVLEKAVLAGSNLVGADMTDAKMEQVDLQEANIRNANFQDGNLKGAKVQDAIVNDATNMAGVKTENVQGKLIKEKANGEKESVSIDEHKELSEKILAAKNKGPIGRVAGVALKITGSGVKKTGEFIEHPLKGKTKLGIGIGVVAGGALAAVAILSVAAAVPTAGISLAVGAGIIGGGVFIGAGVGGAIGYVATHKKMGVSYLIGGVGGAMLGGPFGAALGIGATKLLNKGVAMATGGKSLDELVNTGMQAAGNSMEKVGQKMVLSEHEKQIIKDYDNAVKTHKPELEKKYIHRKDVDMEVVKHVHQELGKQKELKPSVKVDPKAKKPTKKQVAPKEDKDIAKAKDIGKTVAASKSMKKNVQAVPNKKWKKATKRSK